MYVGQAVPWYSRITLRRSFARLAGTVLCLAGLLLALSACTFLHKLIPDHTERQDHRRRNPNDQGSPRS
jgi:hypothetical protein